MLLTATLCLLAYGAVMVYSASSATSLLAGHGNGSGYLLKYLLYGAIGLLLMRLLAADGVARINGIIAPLAAAATGFAGRSETIHAENVWVCPPAEISFAASTAPGGSSRAP